MKLRIPRLVGGVSLVVVDMPFATTSNSTTTTTAAAAAAAVRGSVAFSLPSKGIHVGPRQSSAVQQRAKPRCKGGWYGHLGGREHDKGNKALLLGKRRERLLVTQQLGHDATKSSCKDHLIGMRDNGRVMRLLQRVRLHCGNRLGDCWQLKLQERALHVRQGAPLVHAQGHNHVPGPDPARHKSHVHRAQWRVREGERHKHKGLESCRLK